MIFFDDKIVDFELFVEKWEILEYFGEKSWWGDPASGVGKGAGAALMGQN